MGSTPILGFDPISALCPACGLCCDGSLFADVKLKAADHLVRLRKLGLQPERTRPGARACFSQPCTAFEGSECRIYPDRPQNCRKFECSVLQRVRAGSLTLAEAQRRIRRARRLVAKVHDALEKLGNTEQHLPISLRFANTISAPVDLRSGSSIFPARLRLHRAMAAWTRFAESEFRTP